MKRQTESNWRRQLVFAAIATAVLFAAGSPAAAQKFKPAEVVEVDPSGTGDWMKGTVLPFLEKDQPLFQGEYYLARVLIDKWKTSYPEGVLVQTKHIRASKDGAAKPPQNQNEADKTPRTGNETAKNESGAKFKPGDRVECDASGINDWLKGTVLPFKENDNPGLEKDKSGKYFYIHRVRLDKYASTKPEGGVCFTDRTRPLTGAAAAPPPVDNSVGKVTVVENNTVSADRPILACPVPQPRVKNGARPSAELLKNIIRCDKGEKPADKGMDGAMTIDVTALQIAAPRPWVATRDSGGKPGTLIFPVRATYTEKTFYRTRTVVNENWIRTINFYVNEFGEWQSGSEEPVKSPQTKDIPRLP